MLTGRTRILGVFGDPVEHSLSPAMHNAAIRVLGIDYVYVPFHVKPDALGVALEALRALQVVGVNLTIPHKEHALQFLDEVDAEAAAIGAVNTISCRDGRLIGCNTDGAGFEGPLTDMGFHCAGRNAVVAGAGGAARSVVFRLARAGAHVVIVNRSEKRARALTDDVNKHYPESVEWLPAAATPEVCRAMEQATIVVNATPAGMWPREEECPPLPLDLFRSDMLVYDLIYLPQETRFLSAARSAGACTVNGAAMLVRQGAVSFEVWTGLRPPEDVMCEAMYSALTRRNDG